jgi:hypothetical protein
VTTIPINKTTKQLLRFMSFSLWGVKFYGSGNNTAVGLIVPGKIPAGKTLSDRTG